MTRLFPLFTAASIFILAVQLGCAAEPELSGKKGILTSSLRPPPTAVGTENYPTTPGEQEKESKVGKRLKGATMVVAGKVISTKPAEVSGPIREHSPQWQEATVLVTKWVVGAASTDGKTIKVYFPASKDILWSKSPKLRVHQEGVFILRWTKAHGIVGYTALDPVDSLPLDDLDLVQKLLIEAKRPPDK